MVDCLCASFDHRSWLIKEPGSSSISGVIIIDYRHHQHSGCLPPSSGCLSKHQSFSSNCNCFQSSLFPAPSSPPPRFSLQKFAPTSLASGGIFIMAVTSAVIVAIAAVFTSLPPAATRTSNTQQVHYSSHSIISPTVNQAVSHTKWHLAVHQS